MPAFPTIRPHAFAALLAATLCAALPAAARGPQDPSMQGGFGGGALNSATFDLADIDGDGRITLAEINTQRATMVEATDTNKDGKLSAEELAAGELKMMQAVAAARATERVARLDTDGDGLLSAAELAAPPPPIRMFERIDANGDGAITREEITTARQRMAQRMGGGEHRPGHRQHPADDEAN